MGLAFSIETIGSQITDNKTVKEGLVLAVAYIAVKGLYQSWTGKSPNELAVPA